MCDKQLIYILYLYVNSRRVRLEIELINVTSKDVVELFDKQTPRHIKLLQYYY